MLLPLVICLQHQLSMYWELLAQALRHVNEVKHLRSDFFNPYFLGFIVQINFGSQSFSRLRSHKIISQGIIFQKIHHCKTSWSNMTFKTKKMANRFKPLNITFLDIVCVRCWLTDYYNTFCRISVATILIVDLHFIAKNVQEAEIIIGPNLKKIIFEFEKSHLRPSPLWSLATWPLNKI